MTTHRGRVPKLFNFSGDQVSDGLSNIAGIASWTTYLINHPTRQIPSEICFPSIHTAGVPLHIEKGVQANALCLAIIRFVVNN